MKKICSMLLLAALLLSALTVSASAETDYAALTDEELYREIDEDLQVRSYHAYSWERVPGRLLVTTESEVTAEELEDVLSALGLSGDLDDRDAYPEISELPGGGISFTAAVSEEEIRDILFALHRCEQIASAAPALLVSSCAGPGDVNLDGFFDAKDYMMLKRTVLETYTPGRMQAAAADVNGDGAVNAKDYLMLKRIVLGSYEA